MIPTFTTENNEWREMLNTAKLHNWWCKDVANALKMAEYAIGAKLVHHVKVNITENNIYLDITPYPDGAIAHVIFDDDRIHWSWDVVSPETYGTKFVDARGVISRIKDTMPNMLKVLPLSSSWSIDQNDIDDLLGFDADDRTTEAVQSGTEEYAKENDWTHKRVRPILEFVDYISDDLCVNSVYMDTLFGARVFNQVTFVYADGFIHWSASVIFHDKNMVDLEVENCHGRHTGSCKYTNPKDLFNRLA